jgi:hypothetical protein
MDSGCETRKALEERSPSKCIFISISLLLHACVVLSFMFNCISALIYIIYAFIVCIVAKIC